MTDRDVFDASVAEIGRLFREGTLSPVDLAERCLSRIDALNPTLNAFITVTAELARQQARAADAEMRRGRARGGLHGIPVAVKDFYDTAGIRTTAAAAQYAVRIPAKDAVMVTRLRDAGAVLVGKTNMHTLGMGTTSLVSLFGPVVNPQSARHVAGGSSGGSAAAISAGMCFATIDTDAVGSGRLPAAICGLSCFKPTYGVLSSEGILGGEPVERAILMLSHPSVMARSADDVALAFDALTQDDPGRGDSRRVERAPITTYRIGVATNCKATSDVRASFDDCVAVVESAGVSTRPVAIPFERASFDVRNIERDRASIAESLFADVDLVMLPTLSAQTPTVDEARARGDLAVAPDNTFFCNYFGLPVITIPFGRAENGLPLGIQLVGQPGSDRRVLAAACSASAILAGPSQR